MLEEFECKKCGRCCNKNNIKIKVKGLLYKENGDCIYLDSETKLCIIYDNRPEICALYPWRLHIFITSVETFKVLGFGGHMYQIRRKKCVREEMND